MKLATFQSYIVKNPPPGFGGRYFIFVTLTTSCGITGTGEIYAASYVPEIITAMASDIFQRYLLGQTRFRSNNFVGARTDLDFRIGQTPHFKVLSAD